MFYRLSMPIECAEVFSRPAAGALPGAGLFGPKNDLEDYDVDSDFEVLMKTAHGHLVPDRADKDKDTPKPEFNNHKDYTQEKPSRLKQRSLIYAKWFPACACHVGWVPAEVRAFPCQLFPSLRPSSCTKGCADDSEATCLSPDLFHMHSLSQIFLHCYECYGKKNTRKFYYFQVDLKILVYSSVK